MKLLHQLYQKDILISNKPRSASSTLHYNNGTVIPWGAVKQAKVTSCINNAIVESLFKLTRKTTVMRRFFQLTENTRYLNGPTSTLEDNTTAITQIRKYHLTSQIKYLDLKMTWLNQHNIRNTFAPLYIDTKTNCADTNSKPTDGETLQFKILQVIEFKNYPPKNSVHCKL